MVVVAVQGAPLVSTTHPPSLCVVLSSCVVHRCRMLPAVVCPVRHHHCVSSAVVVCYARLHCTIDDPKQTQNKNKQTTMAMATPGNHRPATVTVVSTGTWGPRVRSDRGKSWEPAHHCTITCDCLCLVIFHCLPGRSITSSCSTWLYCSTPSPS